MADGDAVIDGEIAMMAADLEIARKERDEARAEMHEQMKMCEDHQLAETRRANAAEQRAADAERFQEAYGDVLEQLAEAQREIERMREKLTRQEQHHRDARNDEDATNQAVYTDLLVDYERERDRASQAEVIAAEILPMMQQLRVELRGVSLPFGLHRQIDAFVCMVAGTTLLERHAAELKAKDAQLGLAARIISHLRAYKGILSPVTEQWLAEYDALRRADLDAGETP